MTKKFTTLDLLNVAAWYKQMREKEEKPLNDLPLKVQWNLKKIISSFSSMIENFTQLQQEAEAKIRNEFANDEKSYEDVSEEGEPIRKIKDEFLEDFQQKSMEFNSKLNEILMETNEISFEPISIEDLIDKLPEDTKLGLEDMEMIGLFNSEPIEIVKSEEQE